MEWKLESLTVASIGDVHNARKEDLGVVKNVTRHYTINQKREQKGDTPEERASMTLSVEDPADENKVIWAKSVRLFISHAAQRSLRSMPVLFHAPRGRAQRVCAGSGWQVWWPSSRRGDGRSPDSRRPCGGRRRSVGR